MWPQGKELRKNEGRDRKTEQGRERERKRERGRGRCRKIGGVPGKKTKQQQQQKPNEAKNAEGEREMEIKKQSHPLGYKDTERGWGRRKGDRSTNTHVCTHTQWLEWGRNSNWKWKARGPNKRVQRLRNRKEQQGMEGKNLRGRHAGRPGYDPHTALQRTGNLRSAWAT